MNKVMILDKYLLRQFFPIFLVAISMFVFLLLLIDLFANLIRYLNNEVPIKVILQITFFFIPKSISYALPISLLFASAYTLGDLYAKNELTSIFSSGIPFWRFSIALLIVGLLASVFSFYLDDVVVIPTLKKKNELSRRALHQHISETNSDIVIRAKDGRLVYSVDYFDFDRLEINGVNIVERGENGEYVMQIRAPSAAWSGTYWEFRNAIVYKYDEAGIVRSYPLSITVDYNEHPDIFRRGSVIIQDLPVKEAKLLVDDLRSAGLPYLNEQANYFHRFSFCATSFVVMILSVTMGGRFRKNILLMSLFTSLASAVVYYIAEMLCMAMAGANIIHPFIGAWFPVILFIVIGVNLIRSAKT
ncbi:MAG: LptF/LptG family permease [Treponema sp.]|nr:LptF/LptG family permease [Treponema sp.]MCL2237002.1 LptF/LptG family permease [Treponema sp.]